MIYFDVPFPIAYSFSKCSQRILEECCCGYAKRHLRAELESPLWRLQNLRWYLGDKKRPWVKLGLTELTDSADLFGHSFGLLGIVKPDFSTWRAILNTMAELRHKIVHREPLDVNTVRDAMILFGVLKDVERKRTIEQVFL